MQWRLGPTAPEPPSHNRGHLGSGQQALHGLGRQRHREQESLPVLAVLVSEFGELGVLLNPSATIMSPMALPRATSV